MGDVIDIRSRIKKSVEKPQPKPQYNSSTESEVDLSARIERIKGSINRINQLMAELRSMAGDKDGSGKVLQGNPGTNKPSRS